MMTLNPILQPSASQHYFSHVEIATSFYMFKAICLDAKIRHSTGVAIFSQRLPCTSLNTYSYLKNMRNVNDEVKEQEGQAMYDDDKFDMGNLRAAAMDSLITCK
jgi:hypothetical protein